MHRRRHMLEKAGLTPDELGDPRFNDEQEEENAGDHSMQQ
jgi:hypothetical protein